MRWMIHSLMIVLFCVVGPLQANAFVHKYAPTGRIYHWQRSKLPVKFHLSTQMPTDVTAPDLLSEVKSSIQTWNAVTCSLQPLLELANSSSTETKKGQNGTNLILFITDPNGWAGYATTAIAITEHWYNLQTGEIVEADLSLNGWNTQNVKWGKGVSTAYDIQNTITHELGHVLGLGHSTNASAAMFASANPGETNKRTLHQDDISGICNIYPKVPCEEGKDQGSGSFCYNGRITSVCSANRIVCSPCSESNNSTDCPGEKNFCLGFGGGFFCGYDCSGTQTCPSGWTCHPVQGADQKIIGHNCLPDTKQCPTTSAFCCITDDDCLSPYKCVKGSCVRDGTQCIKADQPCSPSGTCCSGLICANDGTGAKCRTQCDPLAPQCPGTLRCGVVSGTTSGACIPPNNGGLEGTACSASKPCEHQLQCHPTEKICYLLCKPGTTNTCPTDYRCVTQNTSPPIGLCERVSSGQSCTTQADCASGQLCKGGNCASCTDSVECPPQYKCSGGLCLAPCGSGGVCQSRHTCINNLCTPSTTCVYDKDCPSGRACNGGTCGPPVGKSCVQSTDCVTGQICKAGQCVDACNNACVGGEVCINGQCAPSSCSTDAQCGQGLICHDNQCKKQDFACGGNPCTSGQVCVNGRCLAKIGYSCTGNESCASGFCVADGELKMCSQQCSPTDPKSCPSTPSSYFCTTFPNVGLACWPADRTVCTNGTCKPKLPPKGTGCSCNSVHPQPETALMCMLVLLALGLVRRKHRRGH